MRQVAAVERDLQNPDGMNEQTQTPSRDELKSRAVDLSRDAGKTLGQSINDAGGQGMSVAGQKLEQLADYVAEKGGRAIQDERMPVKPEHVDTTASGIRNAAGYLQRSDPASFARDTENAMRAHPYRTLAIGIASGWVIGKLMSR